MKRLFFPSQTSLAPNNLKASSNLQQSKNNYLPNLSFNPPTLFQPAKKKKKKKYKTRPPRNTKHIQSETNQDRHPASPSCNQSAQPPNPPVAPCRSAHRPWTPSTWQRHHSGRSVVSPSLPDPSKTPASWNPRASPTNATPSPSPHSFSPPFLPVPQDNLTH